MQDLRHSGGGAANLPQMQYFFDTFMQQSPGTVLVAAAGNNVSRVTLPAALDRIIAVGSFDYTSSTPISRYQQVPPYRFVMAAGGMAQAGSAFASRPRDFPPLSTCMGLHLPRPFVTGFAAKTICRMRSPACASKSAGAAVSFTDPLMAVTNDLHATAIQNWHGYNSLQPASVPSIFDTHRDWARTCDATTGISFSRILQKVSEGASTSFEARTINTGVQTEIIINKSPVQAIS